MTKAKAVHGSFKKITSSQEAGSHPIEPLGRFASDLLLPAVDLSNPAPPPPPLAAPMPVRGEEPTLQRPHAVPPNDPLAPLRAMSEIERMALFT
jgi:hypothetical protein